MVTRREFLGGAALTVAAMARHARAASMRVGYAAITWGNDYMRAIDEVAALGYHGIQLRAGDGLLDRFGDKPAALRELLAEKRLAFAVFSSGNLSIDPAREQEMFDLHTKHAKFVRDAGGAYLQIIDERPKDRPVVAADYQRLGRLLTELSKRTGDIGVTAVYHHHMNSTGEKPQEVQAVLEAADPKHVRLLFDIAHYQQGGGDPVSALRKYKDWIDVVHLKDVRAGEPGRAGGAGGGYQFVELGRGRVDVPAVLTTLREIAFDKWAVIELDRVPDAGGTPMQSAEMNKKYLTDHGVTI